MTNSGKAIWHFHVSSRMAAVIEIPSRPFFYNLTTAKLFSIHLY